MSIVNAVDDLPQFLNLSLCPSKGRNFMSHSVNLLTFHLICKKWMVTT